MFKNYLDILKATGNAFIEDRIMKLSASLAYYTVLAISPLFIIIISTASLLFDKEAIENKLYGELNEIVGNELALEIQSFVINSNLSGESTIGLIVGIGVLIFAATAVFTEIQDSLNLIWRVKAVPKKGWLKFLTNRLTAFSLIISLGFILLVAMVINTVVLSFGNFIQDLIPEFSHNKENLFFIINFTITFLISMFIFAIIFKVLPDVRIKWRDVFVGAFITTILFTIGRYLIGLYISNFNPGINFGSAGSVIAILAWVYYTAIILYFGAEFTQVYAEKFGDGIYPSKYAVHVETVVTEKAVKKLPPQHPEFTEDDNQIFN